MSLPPLSILYLGAAGGTCLDRANALRRLGHQVTHIDARGLLPASVWIDRITWRLGGNLLGGLFLRALRRRIAGQRFDLCYVDNGEWVTPGVLAALRRQAGRVVNYNIDDPTGLRDGGRFRAYRQSLPYYDLSVVMRPENVVEAKAYGAGAVQRMWRSADEVTHAPRALSAQDHAKWDAEVLFLGTWMPERGPFLLALIELGVPLSIRGPNWHKAPEWSALQPYWRGGAVQGDDYAKAIQCAKVNIGLLSKGNRDLHTTRSLEIPALGALLCAERTSEHVGMYEERREALFWADAVECAEMCAFALADEERRLAIALAGQQRVKRNGHMNEAVLAKILQAALQQQ
ncbi:glycosyltransferase [Janthinobacterium sp.]|uniref:CgeB family protein n=1 Tax=Janthinobacterium sp. TaxID=1871054 RepID=UPI00293D7D97|nr:glycosyltransferase [Janthinobacterium sp.]